jgi:periplasmic protein TonB
MPALEAAATSVAAALALSEPRPEALTEPRPEARPEALAEPPPEARPAAAPAPAVAPAADPPAHAMPPGPRTPAARPAAPAQATGATMSGPGAGASGAPARAEPGAAGADAPRLVSLHTLDPGFRLVTPTLPRYPEAARRLGRPGTVQVELEVAPDGRVTRLDVQDHSPGWGFGAAAREAYARARLTPPRVHGQPVRVRWRRTLHFRP